MTSHTREEEWNLLLYKISYGSGKISSHERINNLPLHEMQAHKVGKWMTEAPKSSDKEKIHLSKHVWCQKKTNKICTHG